MKSLTDRWYAFTKAHPRFLPSVFFVARFLLPVLFGAASYIFVDGLASTLGVAAAIVWLSVSVVIEVFLFICYSIRFFRFIDRLPNEIELSSRQSKQPVKQAA